MPHDPGQPNELGEGGDRFINFRGRLLGELSDRRLGPKFFRRSGWSRDHPSPGGNPSLGQMFSLPLAAPCPSPLGPGAGRTLGANAIPPPSRLLRPGTQNGPSET